jgi:SAM-dependent methyltransferase
MERTHEANDEQAALWNGGAGHAWVETQDVLDRMFQPFEDLLVEAVAAEAAGAVLDVGCGTGSTTLAIARRLGPRARCAGVDISEPMIALARERAQRAGSPATFTCADAQVHAFEPGVFDMIVSRFGVMFFDDPVQACSNLRRAATAGARLGVIVWRGAAENPFMTTAERAAAPLLPDLKARRPDAPGQFAFADPSRITSVLQASGWEQPDIRPIDVVCSFPERELVRYLSWVGPVGLILQKADDLTRQTVVRKLRTAFEPFVRGADVRYTAACWMVHARAPGRIG